MQRVTKKYCKIISRQQGLLLVKICLLLLTLPQIGAAQTSFEGKASWYGPGFEGNRTANGEIYDPNQLTAAHKTLEFGTLLRVTNLANGLSVDVRINDRGPYIHNRVIDLSQAAAAVIGMELAGVGTIRAEFISELGELDFPSTASYQTKVGEKLGKFEVSHSDYSEGTLLLAYSGKIDEPLLVRVVKHPNKENDSETLLVSESLFSEIGEVVKIFSEGQ